MSPLIRALFNSQLRRFFVPKVKNVNNVRSNVEIEMERKILTMMEKNREGEKFFQFSF